MLHVPGRRRPAEGALAARSAAERRRSATPREFGPGFGSSPAARAFCRGGGATLNHIPKALRVTAGQVL